MNSFSPRKLPAACSERRGSTLSEVLVSVLVLSIGVLSVMTLFPLSVLRALRANQFTQATVLRYNAEAAIGTLDLANKYQFFGPDLRPGNSGQDDGVGVGDRDNTANPAANGYHPGPDGQPGDAGVDDDTANGVDDIGEMGFAGTDDYPIWDFGELYTSGSDDVYRVLIDPIGFYRMGDLGAAWRRRFGNTDDPDAPGTALLRRVSGGHPGNNDPTDASGEDFSEAEAVAMATLQDQFSTLFEIEATGVGPAPVYSVTLPSRASGATTDAPGDELADIVKAGGVVKVTVFANGQGFVRDVLAEDTNGSGSLDPGEDVNGNGTLEETQYLTLVFDPPLPASIGAGAVERVVVQTLNEDFTWMISARLESRDLEVDMDVVVFHKRRFEDDDERVYPTTLVDVDPGADSIYTQVIIEYPTGQRPFAKPGDWMLDVENNYWYRVQSILTEGSDSDGDGNPEMILRLDRSVLDLNGNEEIQAAFPRGVVDVYPIGRQ